jgi:NADH dehydrogenase
MPGSPLAAVTGAFSYTGKYITRRLLADGHSVRTLTNHPRRPSPFGSQVVEAAPYNFDRPDDLARSLAGASTLYNTYWIRFPHSGLTFDQAVANSRTLFRAARVAGVGKIIHVSVTNASPRSPLPYFCGKGQVEEALAESGVPYVIVRPALIFGPEDILINNIAWLVRRFPVFTLPGSGDYRLQPVFVEDMAAQAVRAAENLENAVLDAVGPETFTFAELVQMIADALGRKVRIVSVPPWLALFCAGALGYWVRDVLLTRDEMEGLMAGLLVSDHPPAGETRLKDWLASNAKTVGATYASELARHFR